MIYSQAFKEKVLKRILPPNNEPVLKVSKDTGVSDVTIYQWRKKLKSGIISQDKDLIPANLNNKEKLQLLIEGGKVSGEKKGEWLRLNGLHTEHLHQFEQEIIGVVADKSNKLKDELKHLKEENKRLKKELNRKDRALAETAALLTLKKKAAEIWGEDEDD